MCNFVSNVNYSSTCLISSSSRVLVSSLSLDSFSTFSLSLLLILQFSNLVELGLFKGARVFCNMLGPSSWLTGHLVEINFPHFNIGDMCIHDLNVMEPMEIYSHGDNILLQVPT